MEADQNEAEVVAEAEAEEVPMFGVAYTPGYQDTEDGQVIPTRDLIAFVAAATQAEVARQFVIYRETGSHELTADVATAWLLARREAREFTGYGGRA